MGGVPRLPVFVRWRSRKKPPRARREEARRPGTNIELSRKNHIWKRILAQKPGCPASEAPESSRKQGCRQSSEEKPQVATFHTLCINARLREIRGTTRLLCRNLPPPGHREPLLLENRGGVDKIRRYASACGPHGSHWARPPIRDLGFLCRAARGDVREESGDSHIDDFCPRIAEIGKEVPARQWPPRPQSGHCRDTNIRDAPNMQDTLCALSSSRPAFVACTCRWTRPAIPSVTSRPSREPREVCEAG